MISIAAFATIFFFHAADDAMLLPAIERRATFISPFSRLA